MASNHVLSPAFPPFVRPKLSPEGWKNSLQTNNVCSLRIWPVPGWVTSINPCSRSSRQRLSTYYSPSSWSYEFLETLANDNNVLMEAEMDTIKSLEEEVKCMLDDETAEPLASLELIDDICRLGLGYLFEENIKRALNRVVQSSENDCNQAILKSRHASALYFRILRQHGFEISTDMMFVSFMDNGIGSANMVEDARDLLSLYEASHLAFDGENGLAEAGEYARFHLRNMLGMLDAATAEQVTHALELPFHQRMQRFEARWNIATYNKLRSLHQLAKLDFNSVQFAHQQDLAEVSRWWREIGLAGKLSFARDRLMESFFWTVGIVFQPQHSKCRKELTKVIKFITVLDDVYDIYGSIEELELLTNAVERWDISSTVDLPDYMKICFLALYNTVNGIAFESLKKQGQFVAPHLAKVWADVCKSFLQEAKWCNAKYIPTFDEYLNNAWVSSTGAAVLVHAFFLMSHEDINLPEAVTKLNDYPPIIRLSSTILRLANDLGSFEAEAERGESTNAITCYMHQFGESEEAARTYIRNLIDESWKKMNTEMVRDSIFGKCFVETAANLARTGQCQYQYGDGHSSPNSITRTIVSSLIVESVQVD
uniref:Putative isoprene synthase n=1 Tax=Scoparia dulcis TaxID=107240 RepID=A0A1W7HBY0_SCODU